MIDLRSDTVTRPTPAMREAMARAEVGDDVHGEDPTVRALQELGLRAHLDGARIWNACAATGASLAELAAPFDTVSVCFSKGLGAPVGSALSATRAQIEEAHRFRKMLGAGMRQAGILAAGALY